jgi:hypothetical protein
MESSDRHLSWLMWIEKIEKEIKKGMREFP